MSIEPLIGDLNQLLVEAFFADARLVSGNEKNRFPLRVESERDSPDTVRGVERSSFMFACLESFRVSTLGLP
jgi:hypothetical protein